MKRQKLLLLMLVWLLTALAVACGPFASVSGPRCELLAGPNDALRELDWDAVDRSTLPAWITSTFGIEEDALDHDTPADDPNYRRTRWTIGRSQYQSGTIHDDLENIVVYFASSGPPAQEVIDCFGPPNYYRATYFRISRRSDLYVELWYPGEGMIAEILLAAPWSQDEPPHVDGQSPLNEIGYTRWTEPQQMVTLAPFLRYNTLDAYPLKPWPGSFEAIEIEIDPAILND